MVGESSPGIECRPLHEQDEQRPERHTQHDRLGPREHGGRCRQHGQQGQSEADERRAEHGARSESGCERAIAALEVFFDLEDLRQRVEAGHEQRRRGASEDQFARRCREAA